MKKLSIYLYLIIFLLIASIKSSFAIDSDIKDMLDTLNDVQEKIKELDESKLQEAVKIDAAIEEINKVTEFVKESLENNDNENAIKALEFIEKSLTDVGSLIPQKFSSDMSKADLGSFGEDNMKIISVITTDMKTKKEEKLSDLITNMVDLNEKGLASFEINESLKEIGVDTIQLEVALKIRAVDLGKKLQENNLVVIDKRSSLVELQTKLDSIPLQMDQLYNQKNDLLNQVEEKTKQDWVGYEEEHAQFDNQILNIHKKLADIEKSGQ
jgi:hypothetical protein